MNVDHNSGQSRILFSRPYLPLLHLSVSLKHISQKLTTFEVDNRVKISNSSLQLYFLRTSEPLRRYVYFSKFDRKQGCFWSLFLRAIRMCQELDVFTGFISCIASFKLCEHCSYSCFLCCSLEPDASFCSSVVHCSNRVSTA